MSIKVGICALLEARPGKEETLAELLRSAQALAQQEAGTVVWYAFRSGPHSFGIFDAFADEALHLRLVFEALGLRTGMANERPRPLDDMLGGDARMFVDLADHHGSVD